MPLPLKSLRGFGPVEWDLEPSMEPDRNLRKTGLVMGRHACDGEVSIGTQNAGHLGLRKYSQEMIAKYDSVPAQIMTPLTSLDISVVLAFRLIATMSTTIDAAQTLQEQVSQ
jgi:hypothetical protein